MDLLGPQHRGKLYPNLSHPFGFRLGAFSFSKTSDSVSFIMNKNGHNALLSYINNVIYCGLPSTIFTSYQLRLDFLQDFGLGICLDILFDTIHRTISIPDNKFKEICL